MSRGKISDPEREKERGRKISEARRAKIAEQGFLNSPETRAKMSEAASRPWTPLQREKIVAAKKGIKPKNWEDALAKAHATAHDRSGENAPNWKGDDVGYSGLHIWVRKTLGTDQKCSVCGCEGKRKYEWANVSGEYRRDTSDWMRVCVSCHRKHDKVPPWNKGKKTGLVPRTAFKPGVCGSPETAFKPGQAPHNKKRFPKPCLQCGSEFQPTAETSRYCSRECYWETMRKK